MKKFLIIALVAVLVVTGSVYAYAFTTATVTIGVTAKQSDFAEVTANTTYSPPEVWGRFTGTWPLGTLYDIAPLADYTGDLVIQVYLVNAGELIQQYQHLNMALQFKDSLGAIVDDQQEIQVLNLQNAEVLFGWSSGNGTSPYYVEVTGGSYRLHPWRPGGSVEPQIWVEITQR